MTQAVQQQIAFGPFRLERSNARLWRDDQPVALTPKALDVLHFLASRPDRLVTKDELLSGVWPDVVVGDASVKVCVREIRKALGDEAKVPRYIETVHRRGYRFVGKIDTAGKPAAPAAPTAMAHAAAIVGRDDEMRRLRALWDKAGRGQRQSVFITGGPGSGKTALVESFIQSVTTSHEATILVGHCFEQFGAAEPYMPVWEALARLWRERKNLPAATALLLARHAAAYKSLEPVPPGAHAPPAASERPPAADRMLREIADAIESLAADRPVLLLLEDVHWADYSTLDLLSALARRRAAAKLMVLATYRPGELADSDHPLSEIVQELAAGALCCPLALGLLDESAVAQYLAARFAHGEFPAALARSLHQRTDGHPLFLAHLVDDLVEQGVLTEKNGQWWLAGAEGDVDAAGEGAAWLAVLDTQIPRTVRAMIDRQRDRLAPHQKRALEAAAVAGVEFSAAAVAGALGEVDVVGAEQVCEELSRGNAFLQPRGIMEWPDGTVATHFRFTHQLYHAAVYETIPAARRVRLHRTLGGRMESDWGERAPEEAANLAVHFEQGHDWPRAVRYFRHAADAATRQYAHREAVHYLRRATEASERLAPAHRAEHELPLLMSLGVNLQVTNGCAAPEVLDIYDRADALCRASGRGDDVRTTFPVLWGIWVFHKVRSDLRRADELARRLLALALGANDNALLLQAHQAMCVTNLCLGNPDVARDHMEQAAAVYDPTHHANNTTVFGQDPGVASLAFGAVALWLLDRPHDAVATSDEALRIARRANQPSTVSLALHFAAMLHQLRGDAAMTEWIAREAVLLATQEGFSFWLAGARIVRGWATAAQGGHDDGIADIRAGLDAWLATGSRTYHSYYLGLLGAALIGAGRADDARGVLDEALAVARDMREGLYEAELLRLRAEAARAADPSSPDVVALLSESIDVARRQGARAFEYRAEATLDPLARAPSGRGAAESDRLQTRRPRVQCPPP